MKDGIVYDGNLIGQSAEFVPFWLMRKEPEEKPPCLYFVYIRTKAEQQFHTYVIPHGHIPRIEGHRVPEKVQFTIETGEYFTADNFQVFNAQPYNYRSASGNIKARLPKANYIYMAAPGQHFVYRAYLKSH